MLESWVILRVLWWGFSAMLLQILLAIPAFKMWSKDSATVIWGVKS